MTRTPATKSEHQTPRVMSLEMLQQLPATQAVNVGDDVVERMAKSICTASGELWRVGAYDALTGPNFTMETHSLDPQNNHWRHMARAASRGAIHNRIGGGVTEERERGFHCWGCDCALCKKAREIEKLEEALQKLRTPTP